MKSDSLCIYSVFMCFLCITEINRLMTEGSYDNNGDDRLHLKMSTSLRDKLPVNALF